MKWRHLRDLLPLNNAKLKLKQRFRPTYF